MTVPLLKLDGIVKTYPGVRALRGVSLTVSPGKVHALVGENGAGKSTLIRVLAGAVRPDAGTAQLSGQEIPPGDPAAARGAGVAVIYQEFNLVPGLTAAANVFLGREARWLRLGDERRRAAELFARLGIAVDPAAPCRTLSVAQQQAVEITKALSTAARVLVLDEPTAALTPHDADRLLGVVRDLKRQGLGILYVSHRLDEVFAVADRITVLRDGQVVASEEAAALSRNRLIELMVGRRLDQEFPARDPNIGPPRLVVRHLRGGIVQDVSFDVRRGEVLGLTGLVGAGRTEVARLIFGADRRSGGTMALDGRELAIASPRDAIRAGIALLTEDRKAQGLIPAHSVRDNFALPNLDRWSRHGFIDRRREREAYRRAADEFRIKVSDSRQPAATLSGGNQQKLVLARWLERNCEVVIFDEPTRGIDVGAKFEIYQIINRLAAQGKAVLLISSELPEVLGMADRVLVMHAGRVTGEITDVPRATQADVMTLAVG